VSEYDIGFSEKLAETAALVARDGLETMDAKRTILYLCLLSSEIALKALLEKAGKPISEIKARSHNLKRLLEDIDACEIPVEIVPGVMRWCPASRLRAVTVDEKFANATIGTLLEAEDAGASTYPNQIRYGDLLKHYPPELLVKMASAITAWAREHWSTIRVP
jgi:HEPN domain-containing protein